MGDEEDDIDSPNISSSRVISNSFASVADATSLDITRHILASSSTTGVSIKERVAGIFGGTRPPLLDGMGMVLEEGGEGAGRGRVGNGGGGFWWWQQG